MSLFAWFRRSSCALLRPVASAAASVRFDRAVSPVVESLEVRRFMSMTAPTSLAADDVSGSQIDVTFTNANTQTDADWIYIERSQDAGATWAQIDYMSPDVGTMTYHDTNRFPGGAYVYRARAAQWDAGLSDYAYSAYSGTDSAEIDLAAPTGLSATVVSGNGIQLSFTNNADNAEYLLVERSLDGGTTWAALTALGPSTGTVTHTDTPVYPGGAYKYRVRAYADDQDRAQAVYTAYTNVATATVPLNAPTGLSATPIAGGQIYLSFTGNADNAVALQVERSDDGGTTWADLIALGPSTGTVTHTDTPPGPGTYKYRVHAVADDPDRGTPARSAYSNVVTQTVYDETVTWQVDTLTTGLPGTFTVTVKDSQGQPVVGRHVVLTVENGNVGKVALLTGPAGTTEDNTVEVVTTGDGSATGSLIGKVAGDWQLKVQPVGGVAGQKDVKVDPPVIVALGVHPVLGGDIVWRARVFQRDGVTPYVGVAVAVSLAQNGFADLIAAGDTTDANGYVSATFKGKAIPTPLQAQLMPPVVVTCKGQPANAALTIENPIVEANILGSAPGANKTYSVRAVNSQGDRVVGLNLQLVIQQNAGIGMPGGVYTIPGITNASGILSFEASTATANTDTALDWQATDLNNVSGQLNIHVGN